MAMTQAEYARHRGVSRQMIGKLIDKLPANAFVEEGGKRKIDPAAADFALGEVRERIFSSGGPPAETEDPTFGAQAGPIRGREGGEGVARLTQARTASEIYRAKIAELEYEQRIGKLLSVEDVARAMEHCGVAIVRELEQIPNFSDDIVSAMARDGAQGVRQALKSMVLNVRKALETNMQLSAASPEPTNEEEAVSS